MFRYIDRAGRPLVAIVFASLMGALAFAAASRVQVQMFTWLIALSGLSSIFTWGSINAAHIRFRRAWKLQGFGEEDLGWASPLGVWGSYIGLSMNLLILIAQFWTGFAPIGWQSKTNGELIRNFFQAYLAAPVILVSYFGYKLWKRPKFVALRDVDLFTGRRDLNVKVLVAMEREEQRHWPRWKKWYKFFC